MTKIFIDAGHGGKDSGAIGNGLYEKNIVLDLALRIKKLLSNYKGIEIKLSRNTDDFLELSQRTDLANDWGADCLISIHCNAYTSTAKGFESFIYNGTVGPDTVAFQNVLHQEIMRKIGGNVTDRGKKRANFHMCRESEMMAVLTENLFVTNSHDASLLKSDSFLDKIAEGHVIGLEKFFGLERARPPDNTTGELYQVIAGTFSDYDNALRQKNKLKAEGYNAYINKK
jgi:N-acetylmuramoyl-L-alanine amidase